MQAEEARMRQREEDREWGEEAKGEAVRGKDGDVGVKGRVKPKEAFDDSSSDEGDGGSATPKGRRDPLDSSTSEEEDNGSKSGRRSARPEAK